MQDTPYQDILLDTRAGIADFYENVTATYLDGFEAYAAYDKEKRRELRQANNDLENSHDSMQDLLDQIRRHMDEGTAMSTAFITSLQQTYDTLLSSSDILLGITVPAEQAPSPMTVLATEESGHVADTAPAPDPEASSPSPDPDPALLVQVEAGLVGIKATKAIAAEARKTLKAYKEYDPKDSDALFLKLKKDFKKLTATEKRFKTLASDTTALDPEMVESQTKKYTELKQRIEVIQAAAADRLVTKQKTAEQQAPPAPVPKQPEPQPVPEPAPAPKPELKKKAVHHSLAPKKEVVAERPDPVAQVITPPQEKPLPPAKQDLQADSMTAQFLQEPRYRDFIKQTYSSPEAFEAILDSTVTRIEDKTVDPLEKWLGDTPASAFTLLQYMTLDEIDAFSEQSFKEIKVTLEKKNIKYEAFVLWLDLIPRMSALVEANGSMLFGELFARFMIEQELTKD